MTTPDPITTAREALEELLLTATQNAADRDACENAVSKYQAVRSIFDHVEKLKAERDEQWHLMNRWAYNAGRARDDVRTLLRIDDEMEYGKNSQKNLDALEEIRSRYAQGGDEYRRPDLLDELRRLTSQLEQAERVIEPFARQAKSYEPDEGDGNHLAWDLGNVVTIGELRSAAQWHKDRQTKGGAS